MTTTNIPHNVYKQRAHQLRSDFLAEAFADLCREVRGILANSIGRNKFKA